jgi:MoaA/NifB/PqqE/SkfB family radical SAM enzyme
MFFNLPLARTWLNNLWRAHVRGDTNLEPMAITWHATNSCNLRCNFCDDGKGNSYPHLKGYTMTTEEVKHVLRLARQRVVALYITGGEPLIRKDLSEIVRWAKREARFLHLGMVTNGVLLHRQEGVLDEIDDLTISLHSLDEEWGDAMLGIGPGATQAVKEAVLRYTAKNTNRSYRASVSCVAIPDRIQDAREVMHFCFEHGISYAVMPQSVTPYPHKDLIGNAEYIAFIDEVMAYKREGRPVWGSYAYFRCIRDFTKFKCYPTSVPRIYPNGDLVYPCSPLNTIAGNLIRARSFDEVMAEGIKLHGPVPSCDTRCFAQCFIEISHAIEFPFQLLVENLPVIYKSVPFFKRTSDNVTETRWANTAATVRK